jgi:DNA (cytosine-5)-methyltransferase 1
MVKLGGLFSGIGGFELAWTRLGGEVAWMCEIDKQARKVLEARFPGVPIYPDVEQVDPFEVEAVDVLSGGSPCQGFSIAGARAGLEHGESRLFADYVRIMEGLADRGLQWALWENVPGVLSIKNPDGERTFSHVVGALVGAADPVRLDPKRKWNVGLASGAGRAVAWRVLDSRYFGVAQRRRRVFACVAFGDTAANRAGRALLAVGESLRRDIASGESSGEAAAGGAAGRAGVPSLAGPLTASGMNRARGTETVESSHAVVDQPSSAYRMTAFGQYADDDSASTLKERDHKDATDLVVSASVTSKWAKGSGGPSGDEAQNLVSDLATGVRRLTPIECERLQAFPDGWTEPAGSDSARYRALGNAVTVSTVGWILGRMRDVT